MNELKKQIVVAMIFIITPFEIQANGFDIGISISNNDPIRLNTSNVFQAFEYLNQKNIDRQYTEYSGIEPLYVNIRYQDVRIQYTYPDINSSKLEVNIPSIGFRRTFNGSDRNDSKNMALDALREGGYLKKLQRALVQEGVQESENNAVAGNSFALLNQMVRNDFDQATSGRQLLDSTTSNYLTGNLLWGVTSQGDQHVKMTGLSPAYHLKLTPDARFTLHFNSPLIQTNYGAQESYQAMPNVTLLTSINQTWQLGVGTSHGWLYTPNSEKTVKFRGVNILNQLKIDSGMGTIHLANMISQYETQSISGYNPDLQNTVVKTSIFFEQSYSILNTPTKIRFGGASTQFHGDELAQKNVEEISFQLLTQSKNPIMAGFRTEFGSTTSLLFSLGIGL